MDSRDLLILGAVGAAAWFFFFRRQTAGQPITVGDPTGAAGMAPGAAQQTQVGGQVIARSLAYTSPFSRLTASGLPTSGYSPFGGAKFQAGALLLTAKDNNPVPTPPAAPNAFTVPWVGRGPIVGTGSGSTGPNPTINSVGTNPYVVFGR